MTILTQNIDMNPYTGQKSIKGKLKLSTKPWLDCYFNGTPNCDQVKNVTRGKIYDVIAIEGFGDAEDVTFIDDTGNIQTLGDFFFEELDSTESTN